MPGPPPLRQHRKPADDACVPEIRDKERPGDTAPVGDGLAFVAFALCHSPCGDAVVEARLGEGSLLQWCLACADLRIFRSPGA